MLRPLFLYLIILSLNLSLASMAGASTVALLSGQKIEGQIIEYTPLRVTLDVQGAPETFFLGEIASIDGQKAMVPEEKRDNKVAVTVVKEQKSQTTSALYYGDEETSLIRFMDKRNGSAAGPSVEQKSPPALLNKPPVMAATGIASPEPVTIPSNPSPPPQNKMTNMNKNVIPTPGGGLIVVSSNKIIKYDQDLNPVKEIDLN